jgi:hypothetical protein
MSENPMLGIVSGKSLSDLHTALLKAGNLSDIPGYAKAATGTFVESSSAVSGLTAYDLEGPAKLLYPVLTPLRNKLARTSGKGGLQAAWRAIVGINTTHQSSGVSEGNRGVVVNAPTQDYLAAYRGLGFESSATFEAQYAAEGFDDVRARAATAGLHSLMIDEEQVTLGGNGSLQLGTTPTPSLNASTTGGTLATQTLSVICVSMTLAGYQAASVAAGLTQTINRTNADSSVDTINMGYGQKSVNATVAVTGATGSVTAIETPVRGAMAYAWYWGPAGSELLGAITTVPTVVITALATGTQTAASLAAADYSVNGLVYSGLITLALTPGSNAYWKDLGGALLQSDGSGGEVAINAMLKDRWDNYRLSPDTIWCSSQEIGNLTNRILTNASGSGMLRIVTDMKDGLVMGGTVATEYRNRYGLNGPTSLTIRQHPNLPPGTILITSDTVPYQNSNIGNVMQMRLRQDYYQIEWPRRSRKYEYGIYMDGVLQHYFPPAMAVITGIGNG